MRCNECDGSDSDEGPKIPIEGCNRRGYVLQIMTLEKVRFATAEEIADSIARRMTNEPT
jgi:hypothetical protein